VSADADPIDRMPPAPVLAVLVAAGSSSRMGGLDKLDALLGGRPVLRHSLDTLAGAGVDAVAVVTSPSRLPGLAAAAWLPGSVVAVVAGGPRRQDSVAAGVAALEAHFLEARALQARPETRRQESGRDADPVVLVHDAARPMATPILVRAVARAAFAHGAAIPVLPVTETLKRLSGDRVGETVDRTAVVAAQTPQGVRLSLLRRAYAKYPPSGPELWTDEASLLEACKIPVHAIDGEPTNLKMTVPSDLQRAQALLEAPAPSRAAGRVGLGIDGHPFGPEGPLALGGIHFDGVPRLAGHSDGDAALHAVADALLGAAGLGDLGRLFPADEGTPAGVESRLLLSAVAERVGEAGWSIANVDVTIVAARPKLAARLPEMERAIARALGTEVDRVNVKASTGNLGGPEGSGRWVSAQAIAWIVPSATGPDETLDRGARR
jgi:2-C-methyl-D-erythritol 4-phosphate cytidylyltransferase/2-C-methyl-D-erythritol 2,4-cyclodiphosphate synthase